MSSDRASLEDRVDGAFFGREAIQESFRKRLRTTGEHPVLNIHGVTGTGKSFLLQRFLRIARTSGLKTVKVQFDAKDREESVAPGQHHEVLRHIAVRLGVPTPRFATAYLAWSLSKEVNSPDKATAIGGALKDLLGAGVSEVVNFIVTASLGPAGIMGAAAKAGWKIVAERVSVEPLATFGKSPEGKAFAAMLSAMKADDIPSQLGSFLVADFHAFTPTTAEGRPWALIAFDSWEQFEERYPERRSRWHEEVQIVELFRAARSFVQFVIVGQRSVTWSQEDRSLRVGDDIEVVHLQGLDRQDAAGYLRDRRGFESTAWIEAMLDATAESPGQNSRHHALSLGMIADTATELMAQNARPEQLEVRPNDLEDLVRRFLSVREEMEPVFERLALTPRFDGRAIAACLGKPYDEFNSLADFEAMERLSFVERLSDEFLSMHGLMRRMLRERLERYSPAKLRAAHSAWHRHYLERQEPALAFRHALGVDALAALGEWSGQLADAKAAGNSKLFYELTSRGTEVEDEVAYLDQEIGARLFLEWSRALRECHLGEKISQLRQALGLLDRASRLLGVDTDTVLWGELQIERALVHEVLADRANDTADFAESLSALDRAAQVFSRERFASQWAVVQLHRSRLLARWGRVMADPGKLEDALVAIGFANEIFRKEAVPLRWAGMQIQMAINLASLAEIRGDVPAFQASIEAFERALTVYSFEKTPELWADAQKSMGNTLRDLADLEEGTDSLELSALAYQDAERVITADAMPNVWGRLQISQAYTLVEWGKRANDVERLSQAISRCHLTLEVVSRDTDPLTWSLAWGNIAKAKRTWAELRNDVSLFPEAAEGFRLALDARPRESVPFYWAMAQFNLAVTFLRWGECEPRRELFEEAIHHFNLALEVFSLETVRTHYGWVQDELARARAGLSNLTPSTERQ